jgi:hypothetical protein
VRLQESLDLLLAGPAALQEVGDHGPDLLPGGLAIREAHQDFIRGMFHAVSSRPTRAAVLSKGSDPERTFVSPFHTDLFLAGESRPRATVSDAWAAAAPELHTTSGLGIHREDTQQRPARSRPAKEECMRSPGLKIAVVCLLAAGLSPTLWGADLNILGNVNVQGDGTPGAPGNLTVNGQITATTGGTDLVKFFKTYTTGLNGNPGTQTLALGTWDLCFLSLVLFDGLGEGNLGTCHVDAPPNGATTGRPAWTLVATAGPETQQVTCSATCLSFSPTQTGN